MESDQQSILVIYESPSKYKMFRSLFEKVGLDCSYAYTQGRIFDIPDDRIGLGSNISMELTAVNEKRLQHLRTNISKHSTIFCLTDMDDEGEWIADSIKKISLEFSDTTFLRLNLAAYNPESLIEAIKSADESLNMDLIYSAQSRRYIDRYIGYHNNDKTLIRGRVLSPLLYSIYENEIDLPKEIQISFDDNVFLKAKTTLPDDLAIDTIKSAVSEILECERAPIDIKNSLPTTYDCLQYQLAKNPDCSALDAFDELQELYVNGDISYPRTENSKYYVMNGQHSGIKALELEEEASEDDDSLLSFVNKRTLTAKKDVAKISRVKLTKKLIEEFADNGVYDIEASISTGKVEPEVLALVAPIMIINRLRQERGANYRFTSHKRLDTSMMMERIHKLELARPSTLASHTHKALKYTHHTHGCINLNNRGLSIALQGDKISAALRKVELAHEINHSLHKNGLKVDERVAKCLNALYQGETNPDNTDFTI